MAKQQFIQSKHQTEETLFNIRRSLHQPQGARPAPTLPLLAASLNALLPRIDTLMLAYDSLDVRAQGWLYNLQVQIEARRRILERQTMNVQIVRTRALIDLHKYLLDIDRKLETEPLDKSDSISQSG